MILSWVLVERSFVDRLFLILCTWRVHRICLVALWLKIRQAFWFLSFAIIICRSFFGYLTPFRMGLSRLDTILWLGLCLSYSLYLFCFQQTSAYFFCFEQTRIYPIWNAYESMSRATMHFIFWILKRENGITVSSLLRSLMPAHFWHDIVQSTNIRVGVLICIVYRFSSVHLASARSLSHA